MISSTLLVILLLLLFFFKKNGTKAEGKADNKPGMWPALVQFALRISFFPPLQRKQYREVIDFSSTTLLTDVESACNSSGSKAFES